MFSTWNYIKVNLCIIPSISFQGVQNRQVLVINFFPIFEIKLFCFVVAMSDLVHNVDAIHGLC